MGYIIIVLISYLIGSSSMSYYLGKLNNVNLKKGGSGNLGASNAVILMGWKAGILVALHDILKASLAVVLARYLFSDLQYAKELAGIACVLGHIFPFYLKFKGGKGFASYIGMTIALNWKFAIVVIIICAILTLITDYIVTATFTTVLVVPAYFGLTHNNFIVAGILLIGTLVIVYKHRENIIRLKNGTEIGIRSAHKGENRVI